MSDPQSAKLPEAPERRATAYIEAEQRTRAHGWFAERVEWRVTLTWPVFSVCILALLHGGRTIPVD